MRHIALGLARLFGSVAVVALSLAAARPVLAQTAAAGPASGGDPGVGAVVVTAARREMNVQKVPSQISVLTGRQLTVAGVNSTQDLQTQTPGLVISANSIQGEAYIRGIGTDIASIAADPSVAILVDGVYMPRLSTALQDLYDVERVEIVKGPQGTLYGRNATGGVINIISQPPSDVFTAQADALFGNYDQQRYRFNVSGPLGDGVTARLSVLRDSNDGYVYDLYTGQRLDKTDDTAVRATVRYNPAGPLDITLSGNYSDDGGSPNTVTRVLSNDAPALFFGGTVAPNPYDTYSNSPDSSKNVQGGGLAKIIYDFPLAKVTSLSAINTSRATVALDDDGTQADFLNTDAAQNSTSYSEDLQLTSHPGGRLDWIGGFYYLHEDANSDYLVTAPIAGLSINPIATEKTDAYAVYGEGTLHLGDKVQLTAGLRYSDEHKDTSLVEYMNGAEAGSFVGGRSWDAYTPKFSVQVFPTESLMLYASVTRGFKSGGFNSTALQNPQAFDPEYVWSYEGGFKSTFFDHRLLFNADAFYYDYTNLQVNVFNSSSVVTIENAARATIEGLELEGQLIPVRGLTLSAQAAFLDPKYGQYISANPDNPAVGPINLSGNTMERAPKFSSTISAEYAAELGATGTLTGRVEYAYRSRVFFSPYDLIGVSQSGYGLWNARLTYAPQGDRWHVALFAKNIGNVVYYQEVDRAAGLSGTVGYLGTPRTFGIEIGARY